MKWERTRLKNRSGDSVQASMPLVVSASRRTDIPSHYSCAFKRRLEQGYTKCTSRFGGSYYISFAKARFFVFWTKHISTDFFGCLENLAKKSIGFYFFYTLNAYDSEGLEPNLPGLQSRIDRFKELADVVGKERVLWRFDPLILTEATTVDVLLEKLKFTGDRLHQCTDKLVFSFADIDTYRHVKANMGRSGIAYHEWDTDSMTELARGLQGLADTWGITAASCSEVADFEGIGHNRCIDDGLIKKIASHDAALMAFLDSNNSKTDPGQRKACRCIPSMDIGQYNTCRSLCSYCYENTSPEAVASRSTGILQDSDGIP